MTHNIAGPQVDDEIKKKAKILIVFVFVLLGILLLRLFVMQIIKGSFYEELSENNRLRIIDIPAPRGKILDRNGVVLADNRPAYNVMVMPEDISSARDIAARLSVVLDKPALDIEAAIKQSRIKPYDPLPIARDITFEQVAKIESQIFNLPGVSIETIPEREYLFPNLVPHAMGYVGEISPKQLEASDDDDEYGPGDLVGKSGIELVSENTLKGIKGSRVFEVDARGRKVKTLEERQPAEGTDIKLTIDKELQDIAAKDLGDRAGAVVAMVPGTGEILVLESGPSFDPAIFASPMTNAQWRQIIDDPMHPLENRTMRGTYPPGSIMKVVVALAGLHSGILDPGAGVFCPGSYKIGHAVFKCWKPEGHGSVDLTSAIIQSCDVYFYTLGRALGVDAIAEYAAKLGLGKKTGIILKDEAAGLVPTKLWKRQKLGQPWTAGENVITAIGQGYTHVTPLQIAKAMCAVVNGGKLYTPKILASGQPVLENDIEIPKKNLDIIKEALRGAVEDNRGTAKAIRDPVISIGGKTGTAQVARGFTSKNTSEADIPYKLRDHAWFFGFSPVDKPEIVVVALVEHGGHGGSVAAPIVKDIIKGYYLKKEQKEASHEQVRQDIR
jgi:penicillin-binding protein 2